MITLLTSQPKRMYTNAKTVLAPGEALFFDSWDLTTVGRWYDLSNKYFYVVRSISVSPWLRIERYTYDTNGLFGSKTNITLSGFGTFTAAPRLATFQGAASWNFYLLCSDAGWSANFTADDVCTVSISGTTATKGANLSVPAVGSYNLNRCFAVGAVVYAFYNLTASPYTMNVWRKYSAGWSTLSGAALPSSVSPVEDDTRDTLTYATEVYWGWANKQRVNTIGAWSSYDKFFNVFIRSTFQWNLKFDAATDTWSLCDYIFDQVFWEINGKVILHNTTSVKTTILNTSLAKIWEFVWQVFWALSNSLLQWPIHDLTNGVWEYRYWSSSIGNMQFFWFFKWVGKRIWKVSASNIAGVGILFQIDSNDWANFIPWSTALWYELDYYWETSISVFVVKSTGTIYAEITD